MPLDPITAAAVRQLLAADQLRQALDLLLAQSRQSTELLNLSGQLTELERAQLLQLQPADELLPRRNLLREALLAWTEQAAATPDPSAGRAGTRLKRRAFYTLLLLKVGLLLLVLFHLATHGLSANEALAYIGILAPVFVGYILTAAKGLGEPGLSAAAQRALPALRAIVWGVFPLYFIGLFWVIHQYPAGNWSFETARNWLTGIEAALGGVVVYVVNTLFGSATSGRHEGAA